MVGVLEGMMHVQQQGEAGRQRGTQSRLAQLASQAYGAAPGEQRQFVQQAIQSDPTAGFALGKGLQDDRQNQMSSLSQKARMLVGFAKSGNRQYVDSLYPQIAAEAQQLGLGQNIPAAWDDSFLGGMEQLANIDMGGGGTPAGLREFQALTQGLSADDQMAARRVKLGLDGRASSAGYSQVKFTGSDGRERIGVLNGRSGQIDLPDGTSFNPQTGQIAPTQQPMGAPAPTVMAESGQAMPVTQFTGSDGRPVNIGNDIPPHLRQQLLSQTQAFDAAPDGATANLPPVNVAPAQFGGASPFVGRRAEDEAAAKKAAELGVELSYAPAKQAIETQGKIDEMRAESTIKPTKAQEAVDSQYGKDYVEFISGGAADANKALDELQEVIGQLESGRNFTGPALGMLPNAVKVRTHPEAMAAQETVESTVQRSLRVILGAQFTEKEGERLIARAYNPSLPEAENKKRTQRLFDQLKQGFENKAAAARYYETNGTLRGFTGKLPSWGDFNPDSGAAPASGGGMYGPAPSDGPAQQSSDIDSLLDLYR